MGQQISLQSRATGKTTCAETHPAWESRGWTTLISHRPTVSAATPDGCLLDLGWRATSELPLFHPAVDAGYDEQR